MHDAEFIEPPIGSEYRLCAIILIVGVADHLHARMLQRYTAGGRCVYPFEARLIVTQHFAFFVRVKQTAFEIGEHCVGGFQRQRDAAKRHSRVVDAEQVNIAGQDNSCGGHGMANGNS